MKKIKIITDSTCDLPVDIVKEYDIEVIPLSVNIQSKSYRDGIDINFKELHDIVEKNGDFPTTSQINPDVFKEVYEKYLNEGYKIISLHVSSKLSGTYQSALIARNILQSEDIFVIDSYNASVGLGMLVYETGKMCKKNLEFNDIIKSIEEYYSKIRCSIIINDLTNLIAGGRISKAQGTVGTFLGIKPVIEIIDGEVVTTEKLRGNKQVKEYLIKFLRESNIVKDTKVFIIYSEGCLFLDSVLNYLDENNIDYISNHVGCVVGVYTGKKSIGIYLFDEN